ncbi:MAG: restriction endonuclease subunit S, partial [Flavobacteriales bacterium]|nr:restriction endonuclease subunit S [Flavobacteriales bacterium]
KSSLFAKEGVSLVRNINITHGEINWEKCVCYPKSEIKGLDRFSLQENDILISLDRPIISTGLKIAVVTKKDLPCMLVQRVCRINSKKLDVNFKYLFFWFLSQNFIESIDPGRSKGVPHLATRDIEKLFFPLPPMKEQERIVKKVETLMQFCDVLVERVQQSEIHAGQLMQAILQEAFSSDEQEKEVKLSVTQTNENFWFNLKLGIGAVLEGLRSSPYQRGEMVIAKMLYFLQEIYKVSFGLNFVKQKFGPYDAKVKRVIQSDLKKDKAFRVMQVKGKQVYDLGSNSDRLLKYNSDTLTNSRASMEDLLMRIGKLGSDKIELIASICKVIQDEKVIEEQDIYEKLSEWKPEKYTIADVKDAMRKIKYWEWDKKLDS